MSSDPLCLEDYGVPSISSSGEEECEMPPRKDYRTQAALYLPTEPSITESIPRARADLPNGLLAHNDPGDVQHQPQIAQAANYWHMPPPLSDPYRPYAELCRDSLHHGRMEKMQHEAEVRDLKSKNCALKQSLKQALEEKARLKEELEKTEDQFKSFARKRRVDFERLKVSIHSDQEELFRGRMTQQEEAFHVQIEDLRQRLAHQEKLCATLKEQDGLRHRWSDHAVEVKVEEERSHERQRVYRQVEAREKELCILLSIARHMEHIKSRLFCKLVALLLVALACAVVLLVSSYTRVR